MLLRRGRGRVSHVVFRRIAVTALHGIKVASADLGPERPGNLSVAKAAHHALKGTVRVRVASMVVVSLLLGVLLLAEDVVLAIANRFGREEVFKLVSARMLIGPLPDSVEHVTLDLNIIVTEGGVVECTEDIIDDLINRDASVLPCVQDAACTMLARLFQ